MPTPTPPLVAIVDDNQPFRLAISCVLQAAGFATEPLASVAQFVESGVFSRTDCLLLDIEMPGIDGLSLQESLQSTNCAFPVIICSGAVDDELAEHMLAHGAAAFLRKPVTSGQLIQAVRSACEVHA